MVATLALLQAWSAIGQEMQDTLSLDSEVDAPVALTDFLNGSDNNTDNKTQDATPVDTNRSTTSTQDAFLDLPVNASLIDTSYPATNTQLAFLLDQPIEQPTPSFKKHQMMDSGSEDSSASPPPSSYNKHQMMDT